MADAADSALQELYSRRALVREVVVQLVGLLGFAAFLFGLWHIYWPVAYVVGGALLVVWALLKMRGG